MKIHNINAGLFFKVIKKRINTFFALLVIPFFASSKNGAKENSSPNIVIIFVDDMGYADPSCYGNPLIKTPHIDALADNGLRFTNFYVNSPISSPSRVALNTGKYPMRYRIHSYIASSAENRDRHMADFLDPSAPFFARTLKQNGYTTGHFGKWHMGGGRDLGDVPYPTEYGYDKSFGSFENIGDRLLFPNDKLCEQSAKLGKGNIVWTEKYRSTEIYIDSALAFIDRCCGVPFFVSLCPNDVHDPHLPNPSLLGMYKSCSENPWEQKFLAVLGELDNQIGRFISELRKRDLMENTIIIFTGDNGPTDWPYYYEKRSYPDDYDGEFYPPGFTGKFYGRKWSLYEGGIREPFIICWPGHIPASATDSTTVISAIDLFPSLCSMVGIEYPDDLDGTDKSKALLGNPMDVEIPLMWEYASNPGGSILPGNKQFVSPNLAIRQGEWKLLINADSTGAELYNLEMDPGEKNNVVYKNESVASELSRKVISWRKSIPVPIAQRNK